MRQVMKSFRVLEVARFTFVPVAGAILAAWGADGINVEHLVRGDTQRGFVNMGGVEVDPNRGKRSVGIDVSMLEAQQLLYENAETADVFLAIHLGSAR